MSLCILLRTSNGHAMMVSDTALSAEISDITYRISDAEDFGKIFEHNGSLIFCSGLYVICRTLREHICSMDTLEIAAVQEYAKQLVHSAALSNADDVVVLICGPDGGIVTMRAKDDFAIEAQPPLDDNSIAITTVGAHSDQAYKNAITMSRETECGLPLITKVFTSVLDEEVGGHLVILEREDDKTVHRAQGEFVEPSDIHRIAISELPHCVIHATDGVFNGTIFAKDGEFTGKIKAAVLDGKLVGGTNGGEIEGVSLNIGDGNFTVDGSGNCVANSITFGTQKLIQYQYSADNSSWHDTELSSDKYRREKQLGGDWGVGHQYKGTDGRPGSDGDDADVTYPNIKAALNRASNAAVTFITGSSVDTADIYANNIFGGNFYAGDGEKVFANINGNGLQIFQDNTAAPKIHLVVDDAGTSPSIILGSGSDSSGVRSRLFISKNSYGAQILYNDENGNQAGFDFGKNGNITPIGTLNAIFVLA